ncbi:MAG TPA: beta-glucosidase, partial [Bacteroidales bacterium]|nr:beta-glucosidase [Bacteroidales bacterium]
MPIGEHVILLTVTTDLNEKSTAQVTITIKVPSIALNKAFLVSASEAGLGNLPQNAIDGNLATRWSSPYSDPQWYQIDLGKRYDIKKVVLIWEVASAKDYRIEESNDAVNWTTVVQKTNMANGARTDVFDNLKGGSRYIRFYGTARTTTWGYS